MPTRLFWLARLVLLSASVWLWDSSAVASQIDSASQPDAEVEALLVEGRYDDAEFTARTLLGSSAQAVSNDGRDAVRVQLVHAAAFNGHWGDTAIRSLSEQLVAAAQREPVSTGSLAHALRAHTELLLRTGEFATSVRSAERLVAIQESRERAEAALADALDLLARGLVELRRYDEAALAVQRSLAIRQSAAETDQIALARTIAIRVLVAIWKGDYQAARRDLDHALSIHAGLRRVHPDAADLLALDGLQRYITGEHQSSTAVLAKALRMAEDTLRAGHPLRATFLRRLSMPTRELGNVAEARSLQERALALVEEELPGRMPVAEQLTDLADTLRMQGDFTGALPLYERALDICERHLGRDHTFTTTAVYNLSILLATLGDLERARPLHARAIAAWTRSVGATHPIVAGAIWEFGQTLAEQGFTAEAGPLLERAHRIRRQSLPPAHPALAQAMSSLALVTARLGQLERATTLSTGALAVWESAGVHGSSGLADSLMVHGRVRVASGDPEAAELSFRRARGIRLAAFGPDHPGIGEADIAIAESLISQHRNTEAIASALNGEALGRSHSRLILGYLPERQALQFVATRPRGLDMALAAASSDSDVSRTFEAVVRGRALVLDEMAARRRRTTADPDSAIWQELVAARQRLANLVIRASNRSDGSNMDALLKAATEEKERAERRLAATTGSRGESGATEVGLTDLRSMLHEGTALVSFVRYEPVVAPSTRQRTRQTATPRRTPSYMAFVFRPDRPTVAAIQLGTAEAIEQLVAEWRKAVGGSRTPATTRESAAGAALRTRVWDPLAPHLSGVSRAFVVPDGLLNLVSFAALPTRDGRYLLEDGPTIHYLSAERDLVASARPRAAQGGLLVVGGPEFGRVDRRTPDQVPARTLSASVSAEAGCVGYRNLRFGPLPATRQEALGILGLWRESTGLTAGTTVVALTGADATERATKDQIVGKRVVHLATHGFFLGNGCTATATGTRSVGGLVSLKRKTATRPLSVRESAPVSPLLLGGLALSGANRRAEASSGGDDGILTAEEVVGMNLEATEWAVLSACDTGLGTIAAGEGVLGLRRAFQIAGARSVIMSLWSVADRAAQQWMEALYRARLGGHLDTADSSREASLVVLRDRRAKGLSTSPFYWAGFVAAGDWR